MRIDSIICSDNEANGPALNLPQEVAVVGSSANILGLNKGPKIDMFERVIRFNHASTESYEKDVGSKTTDLAINCHVYCGADMSKNGYEKYERSFLDKYDFLNVIFVDGNVPNRGRGVVPKKLKFYALTMQAFNETRVRPYKLDAVPTCGFAFICALINHGIKPHLFGFSSSDDDKNYAATHYFEKRGPEGDCHNQKRERFLISEMIKDGLAYRG